MKDLGTTSCGNTGFGAKTAVKDVYLILLNEHGYISTSLKYDPAHPADAVIHVKTPVEDDEHTGVHDEDVRKAAIDFLGTMYVLSRGHFGDCFKEDPGAGFASASDLLENLRL